MSDIHVIGLQYLDLASILLTAYDPSIPVLGPGAAATQKRATEEMRELVIRICGIATSNPTNQPARMQAYMAISVCGERFEDATKRRSLLEVLMNLESDFGWPTKRVQHGLKNAWGWP